VDNFSEPRLLTLARRASHFAGLATHREFVSDHVPERIAQTAPRGVGLIDLGERIAVGIAYISWKKLVGDRPIDAIIVGDRAGLPLHSQSSPLAPAGIVLDTWYPVSRSRPRSDPDIAPALPEKSITKLGDLWTCGPHRVLCGDATSLGDVTRLFGAGKPVLMVTDPPYLDELKSLDFDLKFTGFDGAELTDSRPRATSAACTPACQT
jgi:hypothetical protein